MIALVLFALVTAALFLGDIIIDFVGEFLWHIGIRLPGFAQRLRKQKYHKRNHYYYI